MNKARCDAKTLYEAGEGRCGIDEETFIRIFSERTVAQLRVTFACYKQEYGHDIMKVLHRGMKGLINDESAIARVMVSRGEVDLKEIDVVYERKYKMSIVQALHQEISGHFKNFCLALTVRAGIPQEPRAHCSCN